MVARIICILTQNHHRCLHLCCFEGGGTGLRDSRCPLSAAATAANEHIGTRCPVNTGTSAPCVPIPLTRAHMVHQGSQKVGAQKKVRQPQTWPSSMSRSTPGSAPSPSTCTKLQCMMCVAALVTTEAGTGTKAGQFFGDDHSIKLEKAVRDDRVKRRPRGLERESVSRHKHNRWWNLVVLRACTWSKMGGFVCAHSFQVLSSLE